MSNGTRCVLGNWHGTPWGSFAGVMVEEPGGRRLLLAPSPRVADFVSATYEFDTIEVTTVQVQRHGPGASGPGAPRSASPLPPGAPTTAGQTWQVTAGPLSAGLRIGKRAALGWMLRALPAPLAAAPWLTYLTDPIARVALPGVRTRGSAGGGRSEFYGAFDLHRLAGALTTWDGRDLGPMTPIEPPVRFGFSSAPRRPSVTDLVTTVRDSGP